MLRFVPLFVLSIMTTHAYAFDFNYAIQGMVAQSNQTGLDVDGVLARISEQENRSLPKTLSENLRLDKIAAVPGRHLIRHYTLLDASSLERGAKAEPAHILQGDMKSSVCKDKTLTKFFKNGVSITERYQDASGSMLREIKVFPADCAGKA